ncbi:T9SS type A sorting domain-containing protein [Cryomorpha ignava]|uniref:T9SS type A sorting domain-containing protein n=1 Tax=Cryomorpha ignava TaxID=101383 RepID=A0A7K3WP33_9FLAO|nr:choice-of-anchor J domain-containing protein [Cryomorpha ignava]NEN23264.1 T9SS type A sorting domain-containing protein [Cryomorpha ignava]
MIKNLLFAGLTSLITVTASAQCMDWVDPAPPEAYLSFGDVPCTGQSREITGFEVYKSEAYILANVQIGDNFTFSMCNGPGAGTWVPEFTVIAPSDAVDNFGAGDGDGCSITWTASEAGIYKIVINEAGNCGVAGAVDGGFPKITTNSSGVACPEFLDGAESFETAGGALPACWQAIDADGDEQNWTIVTNDDGNFGLDGASAIGSFSYTGPAGPLTPDNYLITPQVTLSENESLYYAVRSLNSNYSEEEYSVLVSTTGTDIADFTDEVFADNLEYVNQWQARTVDLSAYDNQTIYLAFRHFGVTDLVGFVIDAVKLPGTVNCNPDAVTELDKVESNLFPNPATDNVNITSSLQGAATVRVFDAIGRVVLENTVNLSQATFTQNISTLDNGIYTIQISTTDKVATQRFVKQ